MDMTLRVEVLGELRLLRDGVPLDLPPSRKARALLGYLALTGRPHRRERLCEMFWDLPDDPRGGLRWALSKLRPLVDEPGRARLSADRERVALDLAGASVDLHDMRRLLGQPTAAFEDLADVAEGLARPLLDGAERGQEHAFAAWLTAERDGAARLEREALHRIGRHGGVPDADALPWLRRWCAAEPGSAEASGRLARALSRLGRVDEAQAVLDGFQGVPEPDPDRSGTPPGASAPRQSIGFCRSSDNVRIAHAVVGSGPPLVKAANWLNHLELDWSSPIWGDTFRALAARHTLVRYDERGNGLSDWDVEVLDFAAFGRDLDAVVDAQRLGRFPLLGMSQGCAVAIDYCVRHPERVTGLVLLGGYASGWRIGASPDEQARREAVMTLTLHDWGTDNPAYRHIFSQTFMPKGTAEELSWFDEFQRRTTSPANAVRFQDAFGDIDVRPLLPHVRVPTLVLHARGDRRIALEQGRELAAGIPNARFVQLDSSSHILLGHEPAWNVFIDETLRFLSVIG